MVNSDYFELTLYDSELLPGYTATIFEPCQWSQFSASQLADQVLLFSLAHGQFTCICHGAILPTNLSSLPALIY